MCKSKYSAYILSVLILLTISCSDKKVTKLDDVNILFQNEKMLTKIIVDDIFSPPVASRIYSYTALAQYEAIRFIDTNGNESIAEKLNGFSKMPVPEKGKEYNFLLAATKAFCSVAYDIRIFSKDTLVNYEQQVLEKFSNSVSKEVYDRSVAFGDTIAKSILSRAKVDKYKQTRGMEKYLGSKENGKWQPTSPDYLDGAEPHWGKISNFSLDSVSQFRPMAPYEFSTDSNSQFYKMVKAVYSKGNSLTEEEKLIARYWDDNPFVIEHSGHFMVGKKKITPGGHWMGIAAIASKKANADLVKTAKAFTLTAISLLDAFISCWEAKYYYHYVRPITQINTWWDGTWTSFLQTPPFPEYTSGHSTISGSAATVLSGLYGDNFSFHDNSDSAFIGLTRDFNSFNDAAAEASISRFYGGIHFTNSLDTGLAKGKLIGTHLLNRVGVTKK